MGTNVERPRLKYMDLAKGICMILLIFSHIGFMWDHYVIYYFYFPVFLVLSGFFLSFDVDIRKFIVNRFNKLVIPFLFFYLLSYLLFYLGIALFPDVMLTEARGVLDMFTQRQWFNGPLWYLLCLFWTSIWLFMICRLIQSVDLQILVVLFIGSIGATLGQKYIFIPLMIDVSFAALPFLYLGYLVKNFPLLYPSKYDKYDLPIGISLFCLVMLLSWIKPYNWIGFHTNTVVGNYYWALLVATPAVFSVLFLCKSIKTISFITFFGAYSIVPFSIHHLIYRPVMVMFDSFSIPYPLFFTAIITVVLSALMIPVMIKYIPWAIGIKKVIR